jgi:hypothetical protein
VGVGVPDAATAKVTFAPATAVCEEGCEVIVGTVATGATGTGVGIVWTITIAFPLVTEPAAFVTTTEYVAAARLLTSLSVSLALVAPEIATPFFLH